MSLGQSSFLTLSIKVEPLKMCLNWKRQNEACRGVILSPSGDVKGGSAGRRRCDEGESWIPRPRGYKEGTRQAALGNHRLNKQTLIKLLLTRGVVTFQRWTTAQKRRGSKEGLVEPRLREMAAASRAPSPGGSLPALRSVQTPRQPHPSGDHGTSDEEKARTEALLTISPPGSSRILIS